MLLQVDIPEPPLLLRLFLTERTIS